MAESYPRRNQARGLWKINDINKNIKELGTFPKGNKRDLFPANCNCSQYKSKKYVFRWVFRKNKCTDLQILVWSKMFWNFFWRAPRARSSKSWLKFSNLLFLVVTKNIYRIFLYRLVGAHLKNFCARQHVQKITRTLSISMNIMNILDF